MTEDLSEHASALVRRYAARGWKIATAESCTGGLVAGLLTDIPGSSAVVERGFVTYSNEAKTELIGVPAELIATHGAVSEAVARAMAEGALARSHADVAVAITGIAGPDGGSEQKPVGTVVFARATAQDGPDDVMADSQLFDAAEGRSGIRLQAAFCALDLLMP